ncbi:DNA-processing protein DprA [Nonomuraea sp. NEAU-A123]|uniref:DNA-processing protein DprA n=1 Tax=Nonomuraea sp. NEAU-A123 TaxID=2839649 RepID=UPI001BE4A6D0|nr:DNA-processing protein DprA [Nonomuraea sp. NEAU-A123]MBT2233444.1 DNA-processing protein DprA [Nonomuraea sp. NEAU-A123]
MGTAHPVAALSVSARTFTTETTFEMVMTMTTIDEQAAVLALTKATHDQPWFSTARVILDAGSALELLDGGYACRDEDDQAHAAAIADRVQTGDLSWGRDLIATMGAEGVHLVTVLDDAYPGNAIWAYDRQPFLWTRGRFQAGDHRAVAVVGEHDAGHATSAARALAELGVTLVAPLRTDLDAAVHQAALAAGGRTLAVLAGGITEPATLGEYASVAKQIADCGAIVSPFWPGTAPTDRTAALARIVTCGLADSLYVVDGTDGGLASGHVEEALRTGKYVFVSQRLQQAQPWVDRAGLRGGMTGVQDIDDLCQQAVNLVDMTPRTHTC